MLTGLGADVRIHFLYRFWGRGFYCLRKPFTPSRLEFSVVASPLLPFNQLSPHPPPQITGLNLCRCPSSLTRRTTGAYGYGSGVAAARATTSLCRCTTTATTGRPRGPRPSSTRTGLRRMLRLRTMCRQVGGGTGFGMMSVRPLFLSVPPGAIVGNILLTG